MQPISTHYSVDYTKVSKLTFEDEWPEIISDTAYFETETEAKEFIHKLFKPNSYWEIKWVRLNTSETYIG